MYRQRWCVCGLGCYTMYHRCVSWFVGADWNGTLASFPQAFYNPPPQQCIVGYRYTAPLHERWKEEGWRSLLQLSHLLELSFRCSSPVALSLKHLRLLTDEGNRCLTWISLPNRCIVLHQSIYCFYSFFSSKQLTTLVNVVECGRQRPWVWRKPYCHSLWLSDTPRSCLRESTKNTEELNHVLALALADSLSQLGCCTGCTSGLLLVDWYDSGNGHGSRFRICMCDPASSDALKW